MTLATDFVSRFVHAPAAKAAGERPATLEVNVGDVDLEAIYYQQHSWPELVEYLLAQAESEPNPHVRAEALTKASEVFARHLSDAHSALATIREAVKLAASHQRLVTFENLAFALKQQQSLPNTYRSALANAPNTTSAAALWTAMARWHRARSAWEECAAAASHALACAADDDLALAELEEAQRRLGHWSELEQTLLRRLAAWCPSGEAPPEPDKRAVVASMWAELAMVYEERLSDIKLAIVACQKVIDLDPQHASIWSRLERLCEAAGDETLAVQVLEHQRHHAASTEQHTALALRLANKWQGLGRLETACRVLEEARDRDPGCVSIYDELAQTYGALGRWSQFVDNCWRHASITPNVDERARMAFEAGRVLQNRLGCSDAAQGAYAEALTYAPGHLNARRGLVGVYRARGEMGALAESLWELADLSDDREEKVACWTEAAALLRDTLDDVARAEIVEARLLQLNESTLTGADELGRKYKSAEAAHAVAAHLALIAQAPFPGEMIKPLRALGEAFAAAGDSERANNAAAALVALRQASPQERSHVAAVAQAPFIPPSGQLSPWPKQMRHISQQEALCELFTLITPILGSLHARPAAELGVCEQTRQADARALQHRYVLRLRHLAATMGISLPLLQANPRYAGFADLVVATENNQTLWVLVLGQEFFAPRDDRTYAFVTARLLARLRDEHVITWPSIAPTFEDLAAIVHAAQNLAGLRIHVPAAMRAAVAVIAQQLRLLDVSTLASVCAVAANVEPDVDLVAWLQGAAFTVNRAGLLICGDLATALAQGPPETMAGVGLEAFEAMRDLVIWALSDAHAALRQQLSTN